MTKPIFNPEKMRLKKLSAYKSRPEFATYLAVINKIRANYELSSKIFNESNIENVYLVCCEKTFFGFVEAEHNNLDMSNEKASYIFVHDMHFAPSMQRSGAGAAVIRHLLNKGLDLEFVVAKANTKANGLIEKFKYIEKYTSKNTRTIHIRTCENLA
jgi:hypothetical protein